MLVIEQKILSAIIKQAESDTDETCGFILGIEADERKTITKIFPVKNISEENHKTSFKVSPLAYVQAESIASVENLILHGVYHSHPESSSLPSAFDQLAAQPNFSYIIVSLKHGRFAGMRCWQLSKHATFEEEKLLYVKSL
jgi:proteasome lid subunit RPN8/RPN11